MASLDGGNAGADMSGSDSLIAALNRAEAPMHHFDGTLTNPLGSHAAECPGCDLQALASALETTLVALYEADAPKCAHICDEELDPRGALLGRVRIWVANRKASRV